MSKKLNRDLQRFREAVSLISKQYKSVLDVGCRDKILKSFLLSDIKYQGIDYKDADEVLGHNLEHGIPFDDKSFDIVFALDVLEHVENIHFLFDEIIRVSKNEAIIALPNMSYWKFRLRFLKGKDISKKYLFSSAQVLDRHRWITSYNSAINFVSKNSAHHEIIIQKGFYQYRSKALRFIDSYFSIKFPNLFTYVVFFHIKKK